MSSRRRIPPEYLPTRRFAGFGQRQTLQHLLCPAPVLGFGQVVPQPHQLQVLATSEELVDRGVLTGETDLRTQPRRFADDIAASHPRRSPRQPAAAS